MDMQPQKVIAFWFEESGPKKWYSAESNFDDLIRSRFSELAEKAQRCELSAWRSSAIGALAEIILLDQFSRNLYRGTARAFRYDELALALAQFALNNGFDKELAPSKRAFLYLPFMHSESKAVHEDAVKLFSQPELENNLKFEMLHKNIIDRFGRYPHRNEILGRANTIEEIEFLKTPGSSF